MKKIGRVLIFLFFLHFLAINSEAQDSISISEKLIRKSSFIPIPIVFYTPETRFGGGAALLYAFRFRGQPDGHRPSQFQLGFAYTQEKQILTYLPFQVFFDEEKFNLYGELGYYRYIYQIYGRGNKTLAENKEAYDANYPRLRINMLRLVRPHLYVGLRYWFDDYKIVEVEEGGLLAQNKLTGSNGGIISGIGPLITFDSRDNIFFPKNGYLAELEIFRNSTALGSEFNFTRISLDAAGYFSVGKKSVLAVNALLVQNFGEPPFQQLAFIGGTKKMRGYFEGRFRDQKLWMLQAEYRGPLFWRMGWVAFGGMGSVGARTKDLFAHKIHLTFGAGLRVRLTNEDPINLRLDVGVNEEGGIFPYLTVTEAF